MILTAPSLIISQGTVHRLVAHLSLRQTFHRDVLLDVFTRKLALVAGQWLAALADALKLSVETYAGRK